MTTKNQIEDIIILIQNEKVIIDSDIAGLYGVETRDINKAVKNNPQKFPAGYVFVLNRDEKKELVEKFHRFDKLKHSIALPKAFTEKGLYMLATILKSTKATETTIAIIETFTKLRLLSRNMHALVKSNEKTIQQNLLNKSNEIISELLYDDLQSHETETSFELNFAILKFKHKIKRS